MYAVNPTAVVLRVTIACSKTPSIDKLFAFCASVVSLNLLTPAETFDAIVIVSVPAFVVIEIPFPGTKVTVSVVVSADIVDCAGTVCTAILLNAFWLGSPPPTPASAGVQAAPFHART